MKMMELRKIHTSYFGKIKKIDQDKYCLISIARFQPKYAKIQFTYSVLAPTGKMLKMNQDEYDIHFTEILSKLDVNKVLSQLFNMAGDKIPVMLCYEKDHTTCHRNKVAKWIEENSKYKVTEYGHNPNVQTSLF